MDDVDRERNFERRGGRRIVVVGIACTIVGAVLGWIVGAIVFRPWGAGDWAMALGGAILIGGIGFVWGGLWGLEAVNPGAEPYGDESSGADTSNTWVRPERDERSA
jgi:hypothetical protein